MSDLPAMEEPGEDVPSAEEVGKPLQEGVALDVGDPEWMTLDVDGQPAFDAMWAEGEHP
ncbi:MAG: hypothetical protein M3N31_08135 [Actinomycetota bacterium]|nr:hypothetical protein [Actinomycetota bacterium]